MANEKRLIDANALIDYLKKLDFEGGTKTRSQAGNEVLHIHMPQVIQQTPTVDAVEVVHGNWNIRCETHRDYHTGEVDEDFYLECSECNRKVWDVSQDDVLLGRYGKICNDYPYCHCGAKMDREKEC